MKKIIILATVIIVTIIANAYASDRFVGIDQLIAESQLIALGTIKEIKDTGEREKFDKELLYEIWNAKFKISEIYKGREDAKTVDIKYVKNPDGIVTSPSPPSFRIETEYVLFLEKEKHNYKITSYDAGVLEKNIHTKYYIYSERISHDDLIEKIKSIDSKNNEGKK